ncbi:DUF58 domain-containing protein [Bacillus niameyensis]|uniref:DUF58 domain-containing protein n=1 Tax=Bacillus niameyensis TaxID=1522308 RepID=UPI00078316A1|nr:DUF58 domain-containing protein [Bacillus niameyensis]
MSLKHEFLSRLRKLRIKSELKRTGTHKGIRRSYRFGSSLEFSDFRTYQPGDDIRQIDWNVYSRTKRHYIKRHLDEQEIKVAIYLDCTSSMRASASKWKLAKEIAASFSFVCLENEDRLVFNPISSSPLRGAERKGSNYSKSVVYEIMNLSVTDKTTSFVNELDKSIQKGRQVTIIITDGMESPSTFEQVLRKIAFMKTQIYFIQVLSNEELSPSFKGDAKLVDSEQDLEINISLDPKLLLAYQQRLIKHNAELEKACTRVGGLYVLVKDDLPVEGIILKDFVSYGILQ